MCGALGEEKVRKNKSVNIRKQEDYEKKKEKKKTWILKTKV